MSITETHSNYDESQIQVLEGLEAVRKRPGMYIGSTSSAGLHHLVYEIVDNSIDEALAGYCTHIEVTINEDNSITVQDNGRGIPVGIQQQTGLPAVEVVFTILHAGGKFGGDGYKVSGGLHGVGASVVNALSTKLIVNVCDGKDIYEQVYERGVVQNKLRVIGQSENTGTKVQFWPDAEIFDTTVYDYDILLKRMREQAFLNGGIKITLSDLRGEEPRVEVLQYDGGICSFVEYINKGKEAIHPEVIYVSCEKEDCQAEIAMQYTDAYSENLVSFANNIHTTEGGMHETGFKAALTRVMNDYAKKKNLLKDKDPEMKGEDFREGLTAIISVKLKEAQFEGQTKTKLGNSEMRGLVESLVNEKLAEFLEENPASAKLIMEKAINASRAREAARKAKESVRRKTPFENAKMPGKLADCSSNKPEECEIYIVEGDSAGGSAIDGRDRKYQAILPLWGKMLNVEKSRLDKIYGNDKLQPVVTAVGAGIGEEFDITKARYHKIVIMADADVDGSHIRTLLLTFFFRFMRPLIEAGYVYLAMPPLYKVERNKKVYYAYTDDELEKIFAEIGRDSKNKVQRYKGLGEMNGEQLWETTMDPERRMMKRVYIEDAIAADRVFSILMGDEVEPRREFIEANAKYVTNLDI